MDQEIIDNIPYVEIGDFINLFTWISGIIGLIILICFFALCSNISKIKNNLGIIKNILEIQYLQRNSNMETGICPKCKFEKNPNDLFTCENCGYSLN